MESKNAGKLKCTYQRGEERIETDGQQRQKRDDDEEEEEDRRRRKNSK